MGVERIERFDGRILLVVGRVGDSLSFSLVDVCCVSIANVVVGLGVERYLI